MKRSVLPLAFALALAGCLEELPSVSRIEDLRILAVRAEPPEVEPGQTVQLDALVVDPFDRTASYRWYACLAPTPGEGFFGGGSETATSGGQGTPLSTDPYGGSCQRRFEAGEPFSFDLGTAATASLTIPADIFDTDAALKLSYGLPEDVEIPSELAAAFLGIAGVNVTVSLTVEVDGRREESTKRVNVSLPSPVPDNAPNLNPAPPAIGLRVLGSKEEIAETGASPTDGRCLRTTAPKFSSNEVYEIVPVNLPAEPVPYAALIPSTSGEVPFEFASTEESLFFSFFSDVGALKKEVSKSPGSPENQWTIDASEGGAATLWVVVRDGRGGTSWCRESLTIDE